MVFSPISFPLYMTVLALSLILSLILAMKLAPKTGFSWAEGLIFGSGLNLIMGIAAIVAWAAYSSSKNDIAFLVGTSFGIIILAVSEILFFIIMLIMKKRLLAPRN